ncbi:MAG TPA: hypothetical protein VMR62_12465 [Bryobacteraceae bacterium]|jgi:predicted nucleic acid-binding protein|nr:hypothetical protein [Bryobacteraceae bacterium]
MLRVVISDTSPLNYLILIGQADLLPALYTEVIIPQSGCRRTQPSWDARDRTPLDCPTADVA